MDELEALLRCYNLVHFEDLKISPWSKQYCRSPFPRYWYILYQIMSEFDTEKKIIEIGCGQGDVTTIFCHLGFKNVVSFERVPELATSAKRRIRDLFNRSDVVLQEEFPTKELIDCDVLILVNCVYKDLAKSKVGYKQLIKNYYKAAGNPRYFIMEVVDTSYTMYDEEFPEYIRLSKEEVKDMFPGFHIQSWATYTYPQNSKSKTLYLLEKI